MFRLYQYFIDFLPFEKTRDFFVRFLRDFFSTFFDEKFEAIF